MFETEFVCSFICQDRSSRSDLWVIPVLELLLHALLLFSHLRRNSSLPPRSRFRSFPQLLRCFRRLLLRRRLRLRLRLRRRLLPDRLLQLLFLHQLP